MGTSMWLRRLVPAAHPVLFATYPLLALFAHNQSEIVLGVLWLPLGVCIGVALALYAAFLLVFKRGPKAGALAAVVVGAFFYYGAFSSTVGLGKWWFFALWLMLVVVAVAALVRTKTDLMNLTLIVTVGAAVLVIGPIARIALYQAHHRPVSTSDPRLWSTPLTPPQLASGAVRRDVYVLIPDDYARLDVLKRYFHFDDASFISALHKRGFVLSPQSRSPYSDSEMNIAAELNMGYLSGLAHVLGEKAQDVRPVKRLIADNRASRLFKAIGYRYVHLDTDEVTFPAGNPDISPFATTDSFPSLWLRDTLLRIVGGPFGFDDTAAEQRYRRTVRSMFGRLVEVSREPGPKFVVFHTLLPHDPYVFGADGRYVKFPNSSDLAIGSRHGMRFYVEQLRYLNGKLLAAVDAILARPGPRPVIVVQADEGFQADDRTFGEAAMRQIRVKGLIALYLPGDRKPVVPSPPNTVNTLRFVFNRYFGTHYPLLRSASYPEGDYPYQFEEMRVR